MAVWGAARLLQLQVRPRRVRFERAVGLPEGLEGLVVQAPLQSAPGHLEGGLAVRSRCVPRLGRRHNEEREHLSTTERKLRRTELLTRHLTLLVSKPSFFSFACLLSGPRRARS